ncbi:hypothetical protein WA026_001623 [Henosepilachna vigintioctopunctata]|uniref:Uncharacterized protein n=1 Tax=Henosepilachna vigintioctopunctata TaxID=420089 RepID=A0AAW1URQ3_9CUCU
MYDAGLSCIQDAPYLSSPISRCRTAEVVIGFIKASLAADISKDSPGEASSAKTCIEISSLIVTVPHETNNFFTLGTIIFKIPTLTTPGFNTAIVGTCFGNIPNAQEKEGTSTCLTACES